MDRRSAEIQNTILELLLAREDGKSICPSEVARKLFTSDWQDHMEIVRKEAIEMMKLGMIKITQGGRPVGEDFKGPIRLML